MRVVKGYGAISGSARVMAARSDDLPALGRPTRPTSATTRSVSTCSTGTRETRVRSDCQAAGAFFPHQRDLLAGLPPCVLLPIDVLDLEDLILGEEGLALPPDRPAVVLGGGPHDPEAPTAALRNDQPALPEKTRAFKVPRSSDASSPVSTPLGRGATPAVPVNVH